MKSNVTRTNNKASSHGHLIGLVVIQCRIQITHLLTGRPGQARSTATCCLALILPQPLLFHRAVELSGSWRARNDNDPSHGTAMLFQGLIRPLVTFHSICSEHNLRRMGLKWISFKSVDKYRERQSVRRVGLVIHRLECKSGETGGTGFDWPRLYETENVMFVY